MLNIVIAALLLILSVCSGGDPCPPKAQLAPCTCTHIPVPDMSLQSSSQSHDVAASSAEVSTQSNSSVVVTTANPFYETDSYYTVVDCKVSKTIEALEETVSRSLNRMVVDKLIVSSVPPAKEHTLARLPSNWLRQIRVRQFEVVNSMMSGDFIWYGNPFQGQDKSLLWFAAHKCFLSGALTFDSVGTVQTKGLNNLPYIQGVDLSNNLLTYIASPSFRYPPSNLSTVILSRNSIQTIEAASFQFIPHLRYVDLSHNLLESIVTSIFASPARSLEHIDLSWNYLTSLPIDFFVNKSSLKIVNLAHNFLYSLSEKPWATVWRQLVHVDITGNFVACNCELMWLLPILSPPTVNVTTTPAPKPIPGQTVLGSCSKTLEPRLFAVKYDLVTLTRDRIVC